ncbi:exonuclease SbcCD subunit D C-terminal domain-containing protein [Fulvivirga maritima]|uniref:exonuclease SbcCD subunit D n=1 Tax=Fulvivirga maritima TaxID=2904247 RepID=UPI001F226168|nr:exonuclease SbcCD subunit D C-terminal domain-containing protein [Fulvivirga maritima]UII25140.1 exonuclease SbcCD subunit D C-terminal domain-containing protein [Fulvivirga maritima]
MKFLHTADWHIGQLFHEFDRHFEHQQFLNWLVQTLKSEQIDVLLISGDIFDQANPSAAAIRLFYTFLNEATATCPDLQVIVTAGNHDSASRLEAPRPLLSSSNIHIIGVMPRKDDGSIDYETLTIPIKSKAGTFGWCLAIPFLRMGDYPEVKGSKNNYVDGVCALYEEAFAYVDDLRVENQPVIALGHLHALNAEITDLDKSERLIMGGVEYIPGTAFPEKISYVALGHIHKSQKIGGHTEIRYSGSPIPMSFGERGYQHQVLVFELDEKGLSSEVARIEVPVTIPLMSVPTKHEPLDEVIKALMKLENAEGRDMSLAPYLQVRVFLDGPQPSLRHKIEQVLEGKYARLARIDVRYPKQKSDSGEELVSPDVLHSLSPLEIFTRHYEKRYQIELPETLEKHFRTVANLIDQKEV